MQKEKKSECQPTAQMVAKYEESKLGPRPLREFPGNYHGKYASSSVGRELNKYTHPYKFNKATYEYYSYTTAVVTLCAVYQFAQLNFLIACSC
jgi:hypothetical protein